MVDRFTHTSSAVHSGWRSTSARIVAALSLAALETVAVARDPAISSRISHPIPRTTDAISIDGVLDEPAWMSAWTYELGFEVQPGENTPAMVRTEVLVTFDDRHLYVGFRAYDPDPGQIRAHFTDRDSAWSDDWLGIVLDTFNDERRDYLLVVNPLGVQMDQIETWPGAGGVWDGIWDAASRVNDWGWSAELEIPFSSLRFQRSEGPQVWGFDAIRGYPRTVFHQFGAFARDRDTNCYLCQAVKIEGFDGVSPGRNLEIVPTLTASRTDRRPELPDGPWDVGDGEFEGGLTARWGMTPNLTLSGTLNPDFSQVEADARQLDVNRPFALFFDEKRPFFMEAADFFATPLNIVYTRTLRDPAWGLKVTGKEGPHTIAASVVDDDVTNLIFPGSQSSDATSLDQSSRATVLRYRRDIRNQYTLGVLAADRRGTDYANTVVGIDGDLRFSDRDRVTVQVLGSRTRYPDEVATTFDQPSTTLSDLAGDVLYTHDTRTWSTWAQYRDIGRDFRADLGFMPQVDYRHGEVGGQYLWTGEPDGWYSTLLLIAKVAHEEDHEGGLLRREYAIRFNYEGPLQSHAYVRPSRVREGFAGEIFDLEEWGFHLCMKPNGHSQVWFNATTGDAVDYANVRRGERTLLEPGATYRFGRHFQLTASYTSEVFDVDEGRLYRAAIGQIDTAWQFNARTFVRAIVQNVRYDFTSELYGDRRDPEQEHLFSQLLFSYKVNPQTVLFLGYSDNSIANQDFELTRADRTVFAKVGYAFVF